MTYKGTVYLKEGVLDRGWDDHYKGGNMKTIDCSAIDVMRDGVYFKFKGTRYFAPHANVELVRLDDLDEESKKQMEWRVKSTATRTSRI